MKNQQGFTLIELMIVVAIIGILAAIAIPQYQNYVARTQINRALGEVSALKTAVEDQLMRGTAVTAGSTFGRPDGSLGTMVVAPASAGNGTSTTAADWNSDGSGVIVVELDSGVSTAILGTIIVLSRTAAGAWECTIDDTDAASWDSSFVPNGCSVEKGSFPSTTT